MTSLVIIDFWAEWCAPCRAFAPVFAAAAARHPDALFAKINTEAEQMLAAQFGIRSIPTLMIFRDNVIVSITPVADPDGRDRNVDWYYKYGINETDDYLSIGAVLLVPPAAAHGLALEFVEQETI